MSIKLEIVTPERLVFDETVDGVTLPGSEGELGNWAERVRDLQAQGRDAHVYFDNTAAGAALHIEP
jgi:F0F1-type ATP synthase epsilon subunit